MKPTLYLHIGAHRTATTTIQRFLQLNSAALQKRGYALGLGVHRHFELVNRLTEGRTPVAAIAGTIKDHAATLGDPVHSILISDEDICSKPDLTRLARLRAHFTVKVIFVMRRQDIWIESWYRQNVKWQWDARYAHLTFDAFLAQRADFFWIHYAQMLDKLAGLFGAEHLIPLVFEPDQMPDGPVTAFCEAVGLTDHHDLQRPSYVVNAAPSPLMAEFMRNLPLDTIPEAQRSLLERACLRADWKVKAWTGPQSAWFMDAPTRASLMDDYAQGNRAVAETWFGRRDLFLQPLPAADAPLAPQHLPASSTDTVQHIVVHVLQAMLALHQEQTGKKA